MVISSVSKPFLPYPLILQIFPALQSATTKVDEMLHFLRVGAEEVIKDMFVTKKGDSMTYGPKEQDAIAQVSDFQSV